MGKASRAKNSRQEKIGKYKVKQQKDRFPLIVGSFVAVLALAITGLVIYFNVNDAQQTNVAASTVSPAGVVNDGFVINKDGLVDAAPSKIDATLTASEYSSDKNNISLYIDYACPHCADFEKANISQIETWLDNGTVDTVTVHPLAFLTQYSLDAANAFSCVANYEPNRILKAHEVLMDKHDAGLGNKQIVQLLKDNDFQLTDDFTKCIRGSEFEKFVLASTERAQTGPIPATEPGTKNITGTPSVFVNGYKYQNDPANGEIFKTFVEAVVSGEYKELVDSGQLDIGNQEGETSQIGSEGTP
jgi:protein-disulfide isomerase